MYNVLIHFLLDLLVFAVLLISLTVIPPHLPSSIPVFNLYFRHAQVLIE